MDKTAREGTSVADLNTDIRFIKGVGETRARALEKLHIRTLGDLIAYYPRRWEDRTKLFPIRDLPEGEYACCRAMLAQEPTAHRISGGQTVVKVRAVDEGGVLDIAFFHQEYRKNALHRGETYIFYGRAEGGGIRRRMANPLLEKEGGQQLTGRIMPVYPLTAGITQIMMAKAVRQGLDECHDLPEDVLPDEIRRAHHLCYAGFALENIHFPTLDAFPLLPFTPPTAFVLRERISRSTTTAMITITTITINTIATTGIQNPVAFCHSPSFLPSTHALFCVPT